MHREEEDADDYVFPLTLKTKKQPESGAVSPAINGTDVTDLKNLKI